MKKILIATVSLLVAHSAWAQSTCGAALTGPFPAAQAAKMCSEFAAASSTNSAGWKVSGSNVYTSTGSVGIGTSSPGGFAFNGDPILAVGNPGGNGTLSIISSTSGIGYLAFADGTGSTNEYVGLIEYFHASDSMAIRTGAAERMRLKGAGQVRFIPLAADPTGAEAGDVYYNSGTNKLRVYDGTTWVDLH